MASACTSDRLGQGAISINDSILHSFNNTYVSGPVLGTRDTLEPT